MKQVIEDIAKALVDNPDMVGVNQIDGDSTSLFELRVAPSDLGKVIGKEGRTAGAIRLLLTAGGMKIHRRYLLEIKE